MARLRGAGFETRRVPWCVVVVLWSTKMVLPPGTLPSLPLGRSGHARFLSMTACTLGGGPPDAALFFGLFQEGAVANVLDTTFL